MKGEDERCLAGRNEAYLAKPVNMDQLRATLERWMPMEDVSRETAHTESAREACRRRSTAKCLPHGSAMTRPQSIRFWQNSAIPRLRRSARFPPPRVRATMPTLAASAHKLKGAAQTIGANGVGTAAAALEQAGKGRDRTRCREGLGPSPPSCAVRWARSSPKARPSISLSFRRALEGRILRP
jgi:hypothetical protein